MPYTSQTSGIIDHAFLKNLYNGIARWGVEYGMGLSVTGSSMVVTIATGRVRTPSGATQYTSSTLTPGVGDATNPRMDAIIWDDSANAPAVLAGTPTALSTSQTRPPLTDLADPNDILLGVIYIPAGATVIQSANVFDRAPFINRWFSHKAAAQTFTTDTTFADVTAATGGTFSFYAEANGIYLIEASVPVTYGGTGGIKMQATGPAAPTLVRFDAFGYALSQQTLDSNNDTEKEVSAWAPIGSATAFSSSFVALNTPAVSSGGATGTLSGLLATGGPIRIVGIVVNGASAGLVTLQAAQNSANSTTSLGIGTQWKVERV